MPEPDARDLFYGLPDLLLHVEPSPMVKLNRAVAMAMHDGPAAGLAMRGE